MFFQRGNLNVKVLLLGLIFILPALVRGGEVIPRLQSSLQPAFPRRGEKTRLTVEVSWPGGPTDLEFEAPSPPSLSLLQLIGSRKKSLAYYREGSLLQ